MAVGVSFGKKGGVNYTNLAGFCIQMGLSPESGVKQGREVQIYAYAFVEKSPDKELKLPTPLGKEDTLTINDDGFSVIFPGIRFLDWSLHVDNKSAIAVIRFGYKEDDGGYDKATADTKRPPSMENSVESGGQLVTKSNGQAILGQESRSQADYGHVIRVATESTVNVGWLQMLLDQNKLIQDAKPENKKKSKETSFTINGTTLKLSDAEFVELEIRYGLANLCSMTNVGAYKNNQAICEFPMLLDYNLDDSQSEAGQSWLERIITANGGHRRQTFTETLTWFSSQASARKIDPRPPELKKSGTK